jgi:hypothetical protein
VLEEVPDLDDINIWDERRSISSMKFDWNSLEQNPSDFSLVVTKATVNKLVEQVTSAKSFGK